jgi:hypothetical protein
MVFFRVTRQARKCNPKSRFDDNYANVYYAQENLRKTCILIALVRSIMKSNNV